MAEMTESDDGGGFEVISQARSSDNNHNDLMSQRSFTSQDQYGVDANAMDNGDVDDMDGLERNILA